MHLAAVAQSVAAVQVSRVPVRQLAGPQVVVATWVEPAAAGSMAAVGLTAAVVAMAAAAGSLADWALLSVRPVVPA
jgi:hypothetical protein